MTDETTDCHCCDEGEASEEGYWIVNNRLYRDPLCDTCRDEAVEMMSELLGRFPEIDLQTRHDAVKSAVTNPDRGMPSDMMPFHVADWALESAGVPREEQLAIIDALQTEELVTEE